MLILRNYRHWFAHDLVTADHPAAAIEALWQSPRVVLSALGPAGTDHRFNFANQAALALFETTLPELLGQPSSSSAEPMHQPERQAFLETVARHGFLHDYSGIRISRCGRRFRIHRATVFNLLDENGHYLGQAATFADWTPLED